MFPPDYHDRALGWNPLSIFYQLTDGGPAIVTAVVLIAAATITFLCVAWPRMPFFSARLFLALAPLILSAFVMFVRLYRLLAMAPAAESDFLLEGRLGGSAFQFGISLSAVLLVIHTSRVCRRSQ